MGWRTLEAEVIAITGTGTRDDNLTLKVLAEEGVEGKIALKGRWILRRGASVYREQSQLRASG